MSRYPVADRLFTLEEALALLPAVRQMLLEVRERKQEVEERSGKLEAFLTRSTNAVSCWAYPKQQWKQTRPFASTGSARTASIVN